MQFCKKHNRSQNGCIDAASPPCPLITPPPRAVTLFEGGRVYGQDVINELIDELHASVGEPSATVLALLFA